MSSVPNADLIISMARGPTSPPGIGVEPGLTTGWLELSKSKDMVIERYFENPDEHNIAALALRMARFYNLKPDEPTKARRWIYPLTMYECLDCQVHFETRPFTSQKHCDTEEHRAYLAKRMGIPELPTGVRCTDCGESVAGGHSCAMASRPLLDEPTYRSIDDFRRSFAQTGLNLGGLELTHIMVHPPPPYQDDDEYDLEDTPLPPPPSRAELDALVHEPNEMFNYPGPSRSAVELLPNLTLPTIPTRVGAFGMPAQPNATAGGLWEALGRLELGL